MKEELRVFLLAYPDNPVGHVFLKVFVERDVPVMGVIVEKKPSKANWTRFKKKVKKDGFLNATRRFLQVLHLELFGKTIIGLAESNGIDVYPVEKFNSNECIELLDSLDVDLLSIVSAPILREEVFNTAKKGCLNAHPGWLPTYRGLGANAYALQNGDQPGVTVHFIDAGIDTGKIIVRERITVQPGDTVSRINDKAVAHGAVLMADVIHQIQDKRLEMPDINEPKGKHYRSMPYPLVKKVNKKLKRSGGKYGV
jgi:methionyl-tRNA formyltransferase